MNALSKLLDIKKHLSTLAVLISTGGIKSRWLMLSLCVGIAGLVLIPRPAYAVGGTEGMMTMLAQLAAYIGQMVASFMSLAASTIGGIQFYTERVTSAIKTAAMGQAMNTQVISKTITEAAETSALAHAATEAQKAAVDAYLKFNPVTGQGFQPCRIIAKSTMIQTSQEVAQTNAKTTIGELENAPGKLTPTHKSTRLNDHYKNFCTEDDKNAGLCNTISAMPNGDLMPCPTDGSIEPGSLQDAACKAYIGHVTATEVGTPRDDIAGTPEGDAFFAMKARSDAFMSVPQYVLAMNKAQNTKSDELGGKSPNELLTERVGTYFGGKDARAWTKAMAVQEDRGLVLEATKMEGLSTWMRYMQYKQMQRMELQLATMLLAATEADKAGVDLMIENANLTASN